MQTYQEAEKFLFEQLPMFQRTGGAAYKADLNNITQLARFLDNPHQGLKCVHVAGTNGKGSTSHALCAILMEAGYKVGLFTSPHLKHFNERIRINGQPMPEAAILSFVQHVKEKLTEIQPSFFEMATAMAFQYFNEEKVDIAIIEVGMGGRLDSTNIIMPEVSVITQIDLDHQQFLGNTLEAITAEKAGIIKEGVPVITSIPEAPLKLIVKERADQFNAPYWHSEEHFLVRKLNSLGNKTNYQVDDLKENRSFQIASDLQGDYQAYNIRTVLTVLNALKAKGWGVSEASIEAGLNNVMALSGLRGRWQTLTAPEAEVKVIADTGHNRSAMAHITHMLKQESYKSLHIVLGMVNDKDGKELLAMLPKEANYYFTQASVPRALDHDQLAERAKEQGLIGKSYPTVAEAFDQAMKNSSKDDLIFVGGSTFVVAEIPILE